MNVKKIEKLSGQYCALDKFQDRCTWAIANFSVGDYFLNEDTSRRINLGIRDIVLTEIDKIQDEIKKAIEV